MNGAAAALRARDLAVGYRGHAVVRGIDVSLEPGALLALVGTNGSGKSTFLRTVIGLLPVVGGELTVLGRAPGAARREIGYLRQYHTDSGVLPLRAIDVVRMGRFAELGLFGHPDVHDRELVDRALERMGITDLADEPLRSLSGGQRQRVHLAQTLAREGTLLLLDEPSAGLDAAGRELYLRAVDEERERGAAVVVSTHDIGEARRADRVVLLAQRVVASGPPTAVLTAENLLDAFGVALQPLGPGLVLSEEPHTHDHDEAGPAER